jgi:predicted Zn-dependent protease
MENEAQLAAVIGHEIGHYLERHTLERLRDIKTRSAFAQFLGVFGLVGAIGQVAVIASALAYSRDQERAADRVAVTLMRNAGYDPAEAPRVWSNLLLELNARSEDEASRESPLFATHPAPEERQEALAQLAQSQAGGETHEERWRQKTTPHLLGWLMEEVKRGRHEQTIALLTRMIERSASHPETLFARGETLRMRGRGEDLDRALADYESAVRLGGEPPETHRGLGLIYRERQQWPEAKERFARYLELAPAAPDAMLIRSYMEGPAT